ncbi:MAG: ribonucleotide reductase subunit alpha [Proteobacteria bacterium]|nr:ribonucleotide reductase subunit alpha [Pseudomonadota bacterium]
MTTSLHSFADLLAAARAQPQPQRLLLVFAAAELPRDATAAERERFAHGEGGALAPTVCVDKRPEDIADFAALRAESELTGQHWDILFVGAMSGHNRQPPSDDAVATSLRTMVEQIKGGHIAQFITVDREGELVRLHAA